MDEVQHWSWVNLQFFNDIPSGFIIKSEDLFLWIDSLPNTSRQHISLDRDWVGCSKYIYKKKKTSSANNASCGFPWWLKTFSLRCLINMANRKKETAHPCLHPLCWVNGAVRSPFTLILAVGLSNNVWINLMKSSWNPNVYKLHIKMTALNAFGHWGWSHSLWQVKLFYVCPCLIKPVWSMWIISGRHFSSPLVVIDVNTRLSTFSKLVGLNISHHCLFLPSLGIREITDSLHEGRFLVFEVPNYRLSLTKVTYPSAPCRIQRWSCPCQGSYLPSVL